MTQWKPGLRWIPHVYSLEIRKLFSYRVDFWSNFLGGIFTEILIAYFLWKSVYEARGISEIGGYSFRSMILYYLLIALVRRAVMSIDFGFISTEIYDGTLNRYLVYPVSFFTYKYVAWIADASIAIVQFSFATAVYLGIFGMPSDHPIRWTGLLLGLVAILGASTLYFLLVIIFEMVSFWAENVWSLLVMLRFVSMLFGGGLIPLALFPSWSKPALAYLPFSYLISFPIRCLMGEVGFLEWAQGLVIMGAWGLIFSGIVAMVWRRGTLQYTGVGI